MHRVLPFASATLLVLASAAFAPAGASPNGASAGMGATHARIAHHNMMANTYHSRNSGLGSLRHPTVGNTANQRTNGG